MMADLAFGKPFGFIKGEQSDVADSILKTMTGSLAAFGLLQHMPWLMNTLGVAMSFAGPMKEWTDWSVNQMKARMAVRLDLKMRYERSTDKIDRSKTPNQISYPTSSPTHPAHPPAAPSSTANPASSSPPAAKQPPQP
jgi:hypothetical protein